MRIKFIRFIYFLVCCAALSACTTLQPKTTSPQPLRMGLKLSPASFGSSISLQQHLVVERANQRNSLDIALEINPQQLYLVGLAFGQRVMTLRYDGKYLQEWRHPYLPKQVRGEDVLEDLQLSLWPELAIKKALPVGWSIKDQVKQRTILFNKLPIMQITYTDASRYTGTITVTNLRYHYRLMIQSLVVGN